MPISELKAYIEGEDLLLRKRTLYVRRLRRSSALTKVKPLPQAGYRSMQ